MRQWIGDRLVDIFLTAAVAAILIIFALSLGKVVRQALAPEESKVIFIDFKFIDETTSNRCDMDIDGICIAWTTDVHRAYWVITDDGEHLEVPDPFVWNQLQQQRINHVLMKGYEILELLE